MERSLTKKYEAVVSMGDPNGIGLEIILKFHQKYPEKKFILTGSKSALDFWSLFYSIPYFFDVADTGINYIPEIGKD